MLALLFAFLKLPLLVFGISCSSDNMFFFIPAWYKYLNVGVVDGTCSVATFDFPTDLLAVGLAVLDMLLRLAGIVAVIALIIAGFTYMTAQGNAEKAASARRHIYQALTGLAIAFVASGLVAYIGNKLSG